MARASFDEAKPGTEECPICLLDVTYVKVLPCSHSLCELCLTKLTQQKKEFPCHVCRKVCKNPDQAINKYFGSIKCSTCLKLKDVDEFSWCCECERLICYRCLTKEHGFDHKLLEWNKKESYEACFKTLTAKKELNRIELEQTIHSLLRPLIAKAAEEIQERSKNYALATSSLAQSFGFNLGSTLENSGNMDLSRNQETLRTLLALSGLETPYLFDFGIPSTIKNPESILLALMKEFDFNDESPNIFKDAGSQTIQGPKQPSKKKAMAEAKTTQKSVTDHHQSEQSDGIFITTKHSSNYLVAKSGDLLKFGPFHRKLGDRLVIGPKDSFSVVMTNKVVVFTQRHCSEESFAAEEWNAFSITSVQKEMVMVDAALDGNGGIHILANKGNSWLYYNKTSPRNHYSLAVCSDQRFFGASLCASFSGGPFLFLNSQIQNSTKHVLFQFGYSQERDIRKFDRSIEIWKQPGSIVKSSSAIDRSNREILLLGADYTGIHMFLHSPNGFYYLRYVLMRFPILCSPGSQRQVVILQAVPESVNLHKTPWTEIHATIVKFFGVNAQHFLDHRKDIKVPGQIGFTGVQEKDLLRFIVDSEGYYIQKDIFQSSLYHHL